MNIRYKHAFGLLLLVFLVAAPMFVAANPAFTPAEGPDMDQIMEQLIGEGAEAIAASIDPNGEPLVLYGRLGVPEDIIPLSDPMFDGCIALGMLGLDGDMLPYLMDIFGVDMGGSSSMFFGGGDYSALQFDGGSGGPDLIEMLGTEFRILATVYLDLPEGVAAQRMGSVLSSLTGSFGFGFSEIFTLRIDKSMFENETLPFDSLDVFIYGINADYASTFDAVLSVLGTGGFSGMIDRNKFINAKSAAAGLIAVPDMTELMSFIENMGGGDGGFIPASDESFLGKMAQQMPFNVSGSLSIGAVAYVGDQVVSSTTTEIGIASLIGAKGDLTPMSSGTSVVLMKMPSSSNITYVTPYADNYTMLDTNSSFVLWNATHFGTQSDYVVHFDSDEFPPMISIERTFSPESTTPGGTVTVTVTVTNEGDSPITNLVLVDNSTASTYTTVAISGETIKTAPSLAPGDSLSMTYEVTFQNEGTYRFDSAILTYDYNSRTFSKSTPVDGYTVTQSIGGSFAQMIGDGWPYSGGIIALIAIVGVVQIVKLVKQRD